ncbi:hypothetical protein STIAU_3750, partial [Stigmatella aurantiaca DW4/3-1]
ASAGPIFAEPSGNELAPAARAR